MNENIRRIIKSMNQRITRMTNLPSGQVDQDVVKVTIAQTDDVANHGHDGGGAGVGLHHLPPLPGPCAGTPQLSAQAPHNPYVCGFARSDMMHGCMVYRERAETAAVSCGTSHASAVSTPLQWVFKNVP